MTSRSHAAYTALCLLTATATALAEIVAPSATTLGRAGAVGLAALALFLGLGHAARWWIKRRP